MRGVLTTLAACHELGMAYRDVKPSECQRAWVQAGTACPRARRLRTRADTHPQAWVGA